MESESLLATYAERVHREHTIRTIGGSPQSISTSQSGASLRAFRRVGCVSRCSGGGMSQRKFMGLGGGATASGPGIPLASERLANAAAEPAYDDEQEFPLVIANIPATPRQKAWAVGVAVSLIVLAAVIAPFARIQLGQINGFVPVLQTALALAGITSQRIVSLGAADQDSIYEVPILAEKLLAILRWFRPALVITHPYEGGHPDHDAAALVANLLQRQPPNPPGNSLLTV